MSSATAELAIILGVLLVVGGSVCYLYSQPELEKMEDAVKAF